MSTTPKGPARSNCVQKRASRIPPIGRRRVTRILVGLMCAVVLTPLVVGDNNGVMKMNNTLNLSSLPGLKVKVKRGIEIYASSPSEYFGNLLNKPIRITEGDERYTVAGEFYKVYPSFSGNQIWVKLEPNDDSQDGGWALIGQIRSRSESAEGGGALKRFTEKLTLRKEFSLQ